MSGRPKPKKLNRQWISSSPLVLKSKLVAFGRRGFCRRDIGWRAIAREVGKAD